MTLNKIDENYFYKVSLRDFVVPKNKTAIISNSHSINADLIKKGQNLTLRDSFESYLKKTERF